MNTNLLFDFTVNKETNSIHVKREFNANLELVWKAWTTAELLDQWWAPRPYQTQTKSMDFRVTGRWFYCMVSPEGEKHWCIANYKQIEDLKGFSYLDAFADENGNLNTEMPRTNWTNVFIENPKTTTVEITLNYATLEDLENIIKLGFKEGFTMAIGNLDELLEKLTKS